MKKNNRGGGGLKLGSHLRSDVHRRQSEGERVFYISHVSFDSTVSKKYLLVNFRHDTASKHPLKPSLSPRVSLRPEVGMQTRDFSITALLTYTHYCKHRIAPSPHGEQTYLYKAKPVPLYRGASVCSLISMIQSERGWTLGLGGARLDIFNPDLLTLCLSFHRLQLLLQRWPLFQTGGQQLEDRQAGWNHKGLARLLSIPPPKCLLIPPMTSGLVRTLP